MIEELRLHNFKAFDEVRIKMSPITLLVGPNNAGKSSILSALRLLIQTIDSNDPYIPLLLNGIMGDFGTYKDIVYGNHRGRPIEIELKIKEASSNREPYSLLLIYKYRTKRRELILKSLSLKLGREELLKTKYSEDTERQIVDSFLDKDIPAQFKSSLSKLLRIRNFLPIIIASTSKTKREDDDQLLEVMEERSRRIINTCSRNISELLTSADYLGAMRRPPERIYLFTGERRRRIGAMGENAANLVVIDSSRPKKDMARLIDRVSNWSQKAGMADSFVLEPLSDRHYEIKVQHPVTKETQNIADVGHGNSQIFPVLVGGYALKSGSIYMIEEPEIHLHPRAQAELGDFFYDLYSSGIQTIIETHSEHLILRLQQYIADKKIPKSDICVYYIYPTDEEKKVAKQLRLNEEGFFIDEWPQGFFPERLEEAKRLARIRVEKKS